MEIYVLMKNYAETAGIATVAAAMYELEELGG